MQGGVLPPPEQKAGYVRTLFGRIAGRYDVMNRLMTLGRDRSWRRYTVRQLGLGAPVSDAGEPLPPKIILDVATGTGDLALEVVDQHSEATVIGLDFAPEMLNLARTKQARFLARRVAGGGTRPSRPAADSALWLAGDALHLPFPAASFDAVVTGFALRNVVDIPATFAEMARVTRPGGRLACLEIAMPRAPVFRRLFRLYFFGLVPLIGGLITGQRAAYTYLPHSVAALISPDEIAAVMRQAGWIMVRYRRLMMGTVAVHSAIRQP